MRGAAGEANSFSLHAGANDRSLGMRIAARQRLPLANARGIHQHASRPAVRVVFLDRTSHELHALAPLLARHVDGDVNRIGGFRDVVGIDGQRLQQFA